MKMEKVKINFSIERKALNAKGYVSFCKNIIIKLQDFDEVFTKVSVWDNYANKDFIFKNDLSDFSIEKLKVIIIENKEIAYMNPDNESKELTSESESWLGFSSVFTFGDNDIAMSISQGAYEDVPAKIEFNFSDSFQSKLTDKYIIKIMELISLITNIKFANAISSPFFLKVRQKNKRSVGWINFTKKKDFCNYLSKDNVYAYLILTNGIIFSISNTQPSSNDNNLINKAISLSNLLDVHCNT